MNYKGLISSAILLLIVMISVISGPGCANIIPPQGGPKDSLPPVLVKATPRDSSRNFTTNKISLSFNEFVELQDAYTNVLISPLPKINPSVSNNLNTVTVKLKDSLEPNTTYSINFQDAIKDFSEGNILKGFTYVFSTGAYIDSMQISGKVILAETGKTDSTLTIMLHTNDADSAVKKEKPRYITRTDGKGNFIFKNLPPRNFYLYALKDESGIRQYNDTTTLFAFADKPVTADRTPEAITLYAYASTAEEKKFTIPAATGGRNKPDADKRLKYQTSLSGNQLDLLGNLTLSFENPLRSFDSSKLHLLTDTLFTPVTGYTVVKDTSNKKILINYKWKENTLYHLELEKDFAEDSSARKLLKTDTLTFKTKKLSDYGSLKLKFRNIDATKNPVLLFVLGDNVVQSVPLGSNKEFSQTIFNPGEYELRILYDTNNDGKWTPGEFFGKHRQPELVKPIERKINVKAGMANDFEVGL